MQVRPAVQRPQPLVLIPARRWAAPEPAGLPVSAIGTDLAEKAGTAMYESDEDRLDAAERAAERNPRAAAGAFSAIACDREVGDEVRLAAAAQLADLDPGSAAPACLAIARDREVGDEVRLAAAEQLADVDPRAAAEAFTAIARDREVGDEARRTAAGHRTAFEPSA